MKVKLASQHSYPFIRIDRAWSEGLRVIVIACALLFTAMIMATRVEQPEIGPVTTGPIPDVIPPESIPSAPIAPIVDSQENV